MYTYTMCDHKNIISETKILLERRRIFESREGYSGWNQRYNYCNEHERILILTWVKSCS